MKTKRLLSLFTALLFAFSVCEAALAADTGEGTYRNVILMIGDGMGENHLLLAEERGVDLFMDKNCDLRGQSKTRSASNLTTDSAAGGTALSCGMRAINHTVGVSALDPSGMLLRPVSITENAQAHGMRTGIITTDKTCGATPAAFSAHVIYRKQYDKITQQQLESGIDLIWANASEDDTATPEEIAAHGYTYVTARDALAALQPGSRSFAQIPGALWRPNVPAAYSFPDLAYMTERAIDLLHTDNPNGFFLLVEGSHIDAFSHRSKGLTMDYPEKTDDLVLAMEGFDNAVRVAVEFARQDGHTLVVVTSDHETGNVYYDGGRYKFHYNEHTGKNVPVFAYCCTDLFENGAKLNNCDIPKLIAAKLGWSASEFPRLKLGPALQALKNFGGKQRSGLS